MCVEEAMFRPGFPQELGGDGVILQGGAEFSDKQPKPTPPFDCPEFSMMFFKVLPCQKRFNHDWTACSGCHPGERARRRCLLAYRYGAKVCPDMQTRGFCPRGEACYMTHGMFEYYMHPLKYKTKMCKSGASCRRHYCFFSHSPEELRESSSIPDEWQLQVLPDGSISSTSAAAVLSCLPVEARAAAQAAIAQLPKVMQMFESDVHNSPHHHQQQQQQQQLMMGGMQPGSMGQAMWVAGGSSTGMMPDGAQYGEACGVNSAGQVMGGLVSLQQQQPPQQQPEFLPYAPAASLGSSAQAPLGGYVLVPQQDGLHYQPAAANASSGMDGMLPLQQQQQQVAVMPAPHAGVAAAAPAAGGGTFIQGSGMQPMGLAPMGGPVSSSWVAGPHMPHLQYAVPGSAGGTGANPALMQGHPSIMVPARGGGYVPAGPPAQAGPSFQQQQMILPQQQGPSSGTQLQVQQQQAQAVSVPLSQALMMRMQQQQCQLLPAGVPQPGPGPACTPGQPIGVAGDQLVTQLQALSLGNMQQQQLQ